MAGLGDRAALFASRAAPALGLAIGLGVMGLGLSRMVRIEPPPPAPSAAPPHGESSGAATTATEPPIEIDFGASVLPGGSLPAGTRCKLHATLRRVSHHGPRREVELDVACNGESLYHTAIHEDVSPRRLVYRLHEEPGDDETSYRYALTYEEVGPRTGARPQVALDTRKRLGRVFRDSFPTFDVALVVDELSTPVVGTPPWRRAARASFRGAVSRRGGVTATTGEAPAAVGAPCELSLRPAFAEKTHDARALLVCGGQVVYGAGESGYLFARLEDAKLVGAHDDDIDEDPAMTVDLRAGTAHVAGGTPPFTLDVALAR